MNRFDGIKKANVKIKRNTYGGKKKLNRNEKRTDGVFWRYVTAVFLVLGVFAISSFTNYDAAELFKQDYLLQYEETT